MWPDKTVDVQIETKTDKVDGDMTVLLPIVMILLMIHFFLLIWTNQWRIKKLVTFVDKFRDEDLLTKKDYEYLYNRYTSFLSYMEFFPDKEDYKSIYENVEFVRFVQRTRRRLKYYAIVTGTCFALLAIGIPIANKL